MRIGWLMPPVSSPVGTPPNHTQLVPEWGPAEFAPFPQAALQSGVPKLVEVSFHEAEKSAALKLLASKPPSIRIFVPDGSAGSCCHFVIKISCMLLVSLGTRLELHEAKATYCPSAEIA